MTIFTKHHPQYFMTSDQVRIFYDTNFAQDQYDPNIPLLIFNYGLVCNPNHFKEQYPFFEQMGYQMLVYNYRGHFNSSGNESIESCTFLNMANDLNELLIDLNLKNYYCIGHSMGVNLCLEFSKLYDTEQLKGMILISGTILPPQEVMFNSGIMDIVTPLVESLSTSYPDLVENVWKNSFLNPINHQILYQGGFNTKKVSLDFVKFYAKKISELPHKLFLQLMKEMQDHQIFNDLSRITTKVLVIGGEQDKVIPLHLQYVLHQKLPSSELYIIKDGSHVPQSDFPEMLNERIDFFIRQSED